MSHAPTFGDEAYLLARPARIYLAYVTLLIVVLVLVAVGRFARVEEEGTSRARETSSCTCC